MDYSQILVILLEAFRACSIMAGFGKVFEAWMVWSGRLEPTISGRKWVASILLCAGLMAVLAGTPNAMVDYVSFFGIRPPSGEALGVRIAAAGAWAFCYALLVLLSLPICTSKRLVLFAYSGLLGGALLAASLDSP